MTEIFVTYWTQKYTLYNYVKKPSNLSFQFSLRQISNVNFSMYTMLAGYVFFDIAVTGKFTTFCIIVIILGILQIFYNEDDFVYFLGDKKQKFYDFVKLNDQSYE